MSEPWFIHQPDWKDSGKKIEAETYDGVTLRGTIWSDDVGFDGEDEFPVFIIELESGERKPFYAQRWRYA